VFASVCQNVFAVIAWMKTVLDDLKSHKH